MPDPTSSANASIHVAVRHHRGRPTIFVNGQPRSITSYSLLGGPSRWEKRWRPAAQRFCEQPMDVYLVTVPQIRPDPTDQEYRPSNFWRGDHITSEPMVQSTDELDVGARFVLEHDPDAMLMVRFAPPRPASWAELHPDEMVVNEAGERMDVPSLASERFARAQAEFCRALIEYVESRPWSSRVIGYVNIHLAEGTHIPLVTHWMYDHSPVMVGRWRAYLKDRYQTVEALRDAHGDATLTFDEAPVPRDPLLGPMREVSESLYWQAGRDNVALRDYLLLMRDLYHDQMRLVGKASREAAPAKLQLHDIGKIPMQGWSNAGFFTMEWSWPIVYAEYIAGSGNLDVTDLLELEGVDGLYTPYDYQVRGAGGVFEPEGIADSAILRDKLFITEHDLRTYKQHSHEFEPRYARQFGITRDLAEFKAVTWRDLATALTRGFLNTYVDHNDDYFSDAAMHEVIRRQCQVVREAVEHEHRTVPGIAVVLDDRASLHTNGSGHAMHEKIMWEEKLGVSRCGVPYRIYMLDDLKLDAFPDHRVFYFPNLYFAGEERKALLRERVLRDGNVVVWGPGAGISDGETIGVESARDLTGFEYVMEPVNYQRRVQITEFDHPITRELDPATIFGSSVAYGPMLYPTTGRKLGLAYAKRGGDRVGLAVESFGRGARGEPDGRGGNRGPGDYAGVVTTAAPLPPDLWRGLARFAGAHVFTDTNDVLLASAHYVALHSLKSGPRTIELPDTHRVTDLVSGERVAESTGRITFDLEAPATHFYLYE